MKRISWESFFNHTWFIDNEEIDIENRMLDINISESYSKLTNLMLEKKNMNNSFNKLILSDQLNMTKSSSIETDDFKEIDND